MARVKVQKPVPAANREEFEKLVDQVAKIDLEIEKQTVALKAKHQALDDKFGGEIKRMEQDRNEIMQRCEPFFFDHQVDLCYEGRREGSTKLSRFGVRLGNPTVTKSGGFKKISWKALGAVMQATEGLKRFTRSAFEVDKETILTAFRNLESNDLYAREQAQDDVRVLMENGFGVEQTDQFWVEPIADDQVKTND